MLDRRGLPGARLTRRAMLAAGGRWAASGAAAALALPDRDVTAAGQRRSSSHSPGRLKQSVSRWPYRRIPFPDFCRAAAKMGLPGVDLLAPDDWERVREYGLVCSMGYPTARQDFIETGFNDPANHPMLLRELESAIPLAARHGVPNVIAMFGNRRGRRDAEAIASCVAGLERIKVLAEEHRVTVCLELLNSKVDHPDYQGDHTAFGVAVVRAVSSPRVRLLYDIYHMQIMEGDVIRTIRDNREHIAHFHTGGVPGRHELDDTQELNWRAIAKAIADTAFDGYVAHEFIPTREPFTSLREAVAVCEV
jgi:hydroxypyruvate isomerase